MLRMYVHQSGCHFRQFVQGHRRVVDKGSRTPGRAYLSAQDAMLVVPINIVALAELFEMTVISFTDSKGGLDDTLSICLTDGTGVGSSAQDKRESAEHNRLACSRLAGNDVEAGMKVYIDEVNQGIIGYMERLEHIGVGVGIIGRWGLEES